MRTSFGLSTDYNEKVYTQIFEMVHYASLTYSEVYNMPIHLRSWWYRKTLEIIKARNKK